MRIDRHLAAFALLLASVAARGGTLHATVTAKGGALADAVVVAIPLDGPLPEAAPPSQIAIDQVDKEFVSRVTVIRVGTSVAFPNRDQIRHQVYSFSAPKRFELPLYAGTPATPIQFDRPGVVTLGCNIHDWMLGYVYVAASPWFAKSGGDGVAVIGDLPKGRYRLQVWHPRLAQAEELTREVTVDDALNETFELDLKPEFRPRRAPVPGLAGYR
jgi:plastocyanin